MLLKSAHFHLMILTVDSNIMARFTNAADDGFCKSLVKVSPADRKVNRLIVSASTVVAVVMVVGVVVDILTTVVAVVVKDVVVVALVAVALDVAISAVVATAVVSVK